MTDDEHRSNQRFELSPTQVAGSALAAMSGAFLASYLGTAGTIIGAVVGSLVATVGTAAYTWWLRRTSEVVKRTATQVRETGMGSTVVIPLLPGKSKAGATTTEPGGDAENGPETGPETGPSAEAESDAEPDAEPDADRWAWARNKPWGKVALAAAGVALAVVAGLTVVESITGKPLSSYTKGGDQTGSTVGNLGRNSKPSPSPSPTTPSETSSPTPTPSPSQSQLTPTPLPTETPTELPTDTPTPTPSPSDGTTATP